MACPPKISKSSVASECNQEGFRLITSHRDLPQALTASPSCDSTGWTYPVIARPFYPRRTCSKRHIYTAWRRTITTQCSPCSWRSRGRGSAIYSSQPPRSSRKFLTPGTEPWRTSGRVARCWRAEWRRPWKGTCRVQSRSRQIYLIYRSRSRVERFL